MRAAKRLLLVLCGSDLRLIFCFSLLRTLFMLEFWRKARVKRYDQDEPHFWFYLAEGCVMFCHVVLCCASLVFDQHNLG